MRNLEKKKEHKQLIFNFLSSFNVARAAVALKFVRVG
jgi:hypothetical protein